MKRLTRIVVRLCIVVYYIFFIFTIILSLLLFLPYWILTGGAIMDDLFGLNCRCEQYFNIILRGK